MAGDASSAKWPCPEGFFCPNGTGHNWQPCPAGTFSNTTGLALADHCIPCLPGAFCQGECIGQVGRYQLIRRSPLPVTHRIQYKISTSCFSSISGTAPQYLSDLLQPYTPARQLQSVSDTGTFVTPHVNTKTFGERSFSYAGPSVWNKLPQTFCYSDSTSSFKAALKTHLFNNYF